jgi:steroid delta-isomerase-like uncharacterized protein
MSEENKVLIDRYINEILNQRKLDVVDEVFADGILWSGTHLPEIRNRDELKEMTGVIFNAFPDIHYTVDEAIFEGDRAAIRWSATGTHQGEWLGVAATGNKIETTGIATYRFAGGRITEHWVNWDAYGQLQQLGVVQPFEVG